MTKESPSRPPVDRAKRTFHIVASRYNASYVDGLVDHATKELRQLAPDATIFLHRVPGSFEIPVIVGELASQNKVGAIIACGVILQGETNHAQNLSRSVTDALQRIAVERGVPIINVVLSFDDRGQGGAFAGHRRAHPALLRELRISPDFSSGSQRSSAGDL